MKYMKVIVPLLVVVAMLIVVLPAGAQGPVKVATLDGAKNIFVRTAGTNEDPFGGLPIGYGNASTSAGAAGIFGLSPFRAALPGGVPSDKSGDGTSARKAVYIGGAWAVDSRSQAPREPAIELPSCATVKSPAGTSRWFKMDTWKNKLLQVWLDDELNTATAPSGSAVFGAGNIYMYGTAPGDGWQSNGFDTPGFTSQKNSISGSPFLTGPFLEGFVMAIYDPDNLKPNYAFEAPNAWLYTVNYSGAGSPRRSGQNVTPPGAGTSVAGGGAGGIHGYGQYNRNNPSHLLNYQAVFDGWVHARVYNQMIWDGVVTVCSYRANPNVNGGWWFRVGDGPWTKIDGEPAPFTPPVPGGTR
jgi:hypothetical protein